MPLSLGRTYHWDGHLWIVITHPDDAGSVAIVNFTSWAIDKDHSCTVEIGEHPFIDRKTLIAYDFARILTTAEQANFLTTATRDEDVSEDLLERIQGGAEESDFTQGKVINAIKASCKKQIAAKRAVKL